MRIPNQYDLYLRSMGKALRITAIFDDEGAANRHMTSSNDAVIAKIGRYIFLADKGDMGTPIMNKKTHIAQDSADPFKRIEELETLLRMKDAI